MITCSHGRHIGPLRPRPDMDEWLGKLREEGHVPGFATEPHYDCGACRSTVIIAASALEVAS